MDNFDWLTDALEEEFPNAELKWALFDLNNRCGVALSVIKNGERYRNAFRFDLYDESGDLVDLDEPDNREEVLSRGIFFFREWLDKEVYA
ncbi:MAG: hypothetical protein E3J60_04685 [Dehalococcoidia bacterium]|nr:MAG: hypothetical protein E3J60_04685 [Dehalococcoidia bacterium]